jgi:hypothetical protein
MGFEAENFAIASAWLGGGYLRSGLLGQEQQEWRRRGQKTAGQAYWNWRHVNPNGACGTRVK